MHTRSIDQTSIGRHRIYISRITGCRMKKGNPLRVPYVKKPPLVMDCSVFMWTVFLVFNVVSFVSAREPELNKACTTVKECGKFGYVCSKNFTCQCRAGSHVPDDSRERCVGYVGARCKYDEHCVEGAYCENNFKCQCKEDFFLDQNGRTCSSSAANTAYQRFVFPFTCLALWLTKTLLF